MIIWRLYQSNVESWLGYISCFYVRLPHKWKDDPTRLCSHEQFAIEIQKYSVFETNYNE